MNLTEIPDIQEATRLLYQAEQSFPSDNSADLFIDALEILDGSLESNSPDEETGQCIHSLKLSYAKELVEKLNALREVEFSCLIRYFYMVPEVLEEEFFSLRVQQPELMNTFDSCRKRHTEQYGRHLREAILSLSDSVTLW